MATGDDDAYRLHGTTCLGYDEQLCEDGQPRRRMGTGCVVTDSQKRVL